MLAFWKIKIWFLVNDEQINDHNTLIKQKRNGYGGQAPIVTLPKNPPGASGRLRAPAGASGASGRLRAPPGVHRWGPGREKKLKSMGKILRPNMADSKC